MHAFIQCCGLLLWIYLVNIVQCVEECTLEEFKQKEFFDDNLEWRGLNARYNKGDSMRVHCKVGFRGFFKLICSDNGWFKQGDKCRPISCGHPGDVQFADFALVRGSDYEFGSQVRYTCHKGYQMTSYTSTRNCLQGGWDGHLPVCEPISCQPLNVDHKVLVNGNIERATSGSVIQFSCRDRGDQLIGPMQIFCKDNGEWSEEVTPTCKEISCLIPELIHFNVEGGKTVYKERDVLRYKCERGYTKVDGRPSMCTKVGQTARWTPKPECEPITCKLEPYPKEGTTYDSRGKMSFAPEETVRVRCGDKHWVKSLELQEAELICQPSGDWDFKAECERVTCSKDAPYVTWWAGGYYESSVYMDQTRRYQCHQDYNEASRTALCTRYGWTPKPLCKAKGCGKHVYENAEITDHYQKDKYDHNERVNFRCVYDPALSFTVYCDFGQWKGNVERCKGEPCTTQPSIKNGEMSSERKSSYEDKESVWFRCNDESNHFQATCKAGVWTYTKSCQDVPCRNQPEIKNAEMMSRTSPPYSHGSSVSLTCTTGAKERFSVSCQSGEWTKHQCPEQSICGDSELANGFSHEYKGKLYYSCVDGYKLPGKAWWDEASCVNGKWDTKECIVSSNCGPLPDIPNLNATYQIKSFPDGHKIPIHCEAGFQNLHSDLTVITCLNGIWKSNNVEFKQICTPIKKPCRAPSRVRNAVIMAPNEKEYPSGTVLTYKCQDTYTMEGNGAVQCDNGQWGQQVISCTAPPAAQ